MRMTRSVTAILGCSLLTAGFVLLSCTHTPEPSKTGSYKEAKSRCGNRLVSDPQINKPSGLECDPIIIANETNPNATGEGNPMPGENDIVEYECGSCS
jgi:hypothetical protein